MAPEDRPKVGSLKCGCGAIWPDERRKIAPKHIWNSKDFKSGKKLTVSDQLRCQNSARRFQRSSFGSSDVDKVYAIVARCMFLSQAVQKHQVLGPLLTGSDVVLRGRRKGLCTSSKVSNCEDFVAVSTTTTTTLQLQL